MFGFDLTYFLLVMVLVLGSVARYVGHLLG
jgi:hypothetical protein